jgi:hypothetical protein
VGFKCQHEQNIYLRLTQLPVQWFSRGSFPGDKVVRQGMRLNIHLHFLPVLEVIRAICPLPLCAFMMHTGTTLLFLLLYMGLQTNVVYCAVLEVTVRLVSTLVEHLMMIVCFLLGNSPASEFYMPTFRNTLSVPSS